MAAQKPLLVRWARRDQRSLERFAAEAYPEECCGFLFGVEEGRGWRLVEVWPARNASESPDKGFELDGREQVAAMRYADAQQLPLIGHFHSHPNGRRGPSPADFVLAGGDPAFLQASERATLPSELQDRTPRPLPDSSLHFIVAVENGRSLETSAWQMRRDLSGFDRIDLEVFDDIHAIRKE